MLRYNKSTDKEGIGMILRILMRIFHFFKAIHLVWKYGPDVIFDSLTDLLGREVFLITAEKEIARAKRYGYVFSLVLVDIDNLKEVNDKHGHSEGDELIMNTAKFLELCCRESDYVFRYGGDEFIILLTNTDKKGVIVFEEELGKKLKKNEGFSFSFGSSTWDGQGIKNLIQIADTRMYRQKKERKEGKC